jgi:hypothetical protein
MHEPLELPQGPIIYSVTVNIEQPLAEDWLLWMLGTHIPDVMHTGCFLDFNLQELLEPEPQEGTVTFNIQYICPNQDALRAYQAEHSARLQAEHSERYTNHYVAFRTVLNRIK